MMSAISRFWAGRGLYRCVMLNAMVEHTGTRSSDGAFMRPNTFGAATAPNTPATLPIQATPKDPVSSPLLSTWYTPRAVPTVTHTAPPSDNSWDPTPTVVAVIGKEPTQVAQRGAIDASLERTDEDFCGDATDVQRRLSGHFHGCIADRAGCTRGVRYRVENSNAVLLADR